MLAHGRVADDLDAEVEITGQAAHDRQLLEVLLAEHRHIRACGGEQLGDHRGDAVEVTGPRRPLPSAPTARRRVTVVENPSAIHRRRGRHIDHVDAGIVAGAQVVVERAGVVLEVAALTELQWIDEDRDDDPIGVRRQRSAISSRWPP